MKENTVPTTTQGQQVPDTREEEYTLTPPVDIFETQDGLAVLVDLPGVTRDKVSVDVADNVLTIQGTPEAAAQGNPVLREYTLRPFFRQFQLSEEVDQEQIRAEMKHGVLSLRLPRVAARQPRKIEVSVAS